MGTFLRIVIILRTILHELEENPVYAKNHGYNRKTKLFLTFIYRILASHVLPLILIFYPFSEKKNISRKHFEQGQEIFLEV